MFNNRKTGILEFLVFLGVIAGAIALGFLVNQAIHYFFDSSAAEIVDIPSWQERELILEITQLASPNVLESVEVSFDSKNEYLFYVTFKPDQRDEKEAKKLASSIKKYLKRKARKGTDPPMKINQTSLIVKYSYDDQEDVLIECYRFLGFWTQKTTHYQGTVPVHRSR